MTPQSSRLQLNPCVSLDATQLRSYRDEVPSEAGAGALVPPGAAEVRNGFEIIANLREGDTPVAGTPRMFEKLCRTVDVE